MTDALNIVDHVSEGRAVGRYGPAAEPANRTDYALFTALCIISMI